MQPSHADKAADPKVLKWMTDLTKIRKQLKGKSGFVSRGSDLAVEFVIVSVIPLLGSLGPAPVGQSGEVWSYTACL